MRNLMCYLFIGTLISCHSINNKWEQSEFITPQIINTQYTDSIKSNPFHAEYVSGVFPLFAGKYKFQKEIDINPKKKDTAINKDFINGYSMVRMNESVDIVGFELIVDYDNTVKYSRYHQFDSTVNDYFPVYFVNSTKRDKVFYGKDSHAFGIQEAVQKKNYPHWRPIEARGYNFCGNGTWGLIVHPQEFIVILMRKYDGDYKTDMRVRFEIGENIFVSRSFIGIINESQFSIKDSTYLKTSLQETDGKAANWLFYGAIPKADGIK